MLVAEKESKAADEKQLPAPAVNDEEAEVEVEFDNEETAHLVVEYEEIVCLVVEPLLGVTEMGVTEMFEHFLGVTEMFEQSAKLISEEQEELGEVDEEIKRLAVQTLWTGKRFAEEEVLEAVAGVTANLTDAALENC